jgi:hypothetical protein
MAILFVTRGEGGSDGFFNILDGYFLPRGLDGDTVRTLDLKVAAAQSEVPQRGFNAPWIHIGGLAGLWGLAKVDLSQAGKKDWVIALDGPDIGEVNLSGHSVLRLIEPDHNLRSKRDRRLFWGRAH